MPFRSEKQRKWMWANEPEMAEEWTNEEDDNEEDNVKITKREIKEIINEVCNEPFSKMKSRAHPDIRRAVQSQRRSGVLSEMWGDSIETGSNLIEFGRAYSGLGNAVQDQVDAIVGAFINGGGPGSEAFMEVVYEQNPNAVDVAMRRLAGPLRYLDNPEADDILQALEEAEAIFKQGDDEVEADARAAGDL